MSQITRDPWKTTAFVTIGICAVVLIYIGLSVMNAHKKPSDDPNIAIELDLIQRFVAGGDYHKKRGDFSNKLQQLLTYKKSESISPNQMATVQGLIASFEKAQAINHTFLSCEKLIGNNKESNARDILEKALDQYPKKQVGYQELKDLNERVKKIEYRKKELKKVYLTFSANLIKGNVDNCFMKVHPKTRKERGTAFKIIFARLHKKITRNGVQKDDVRIKDIHWKETSKLAFVYSECYVKSQWIDLNTTRWEYLDGKWYFNPFNH